MIDDRMSRAKIYTDRYTLNEELLSRRKSGPPRGDCRDPSLSAPSYRSAPVSTPLWRNTMTSRQPETFNLHVPDAALADLRERLSRTRFPDQAPGEAWAYGTDLDWMAGLVDYWRDGFDWRAQEARLNSFPQYKVSLQGIDLHFMHVLGNGPDPHTLAP